MTLRNGPHVASMVDARPSWAPSELGGEVSTIDYGPPSVVARDRRREGLLRSRADEARHASIAVWGRPLRLRTFSLLGSLVMRTDALSTEPALGWTYAGLMADSTRAALALNQRHSQSVVDLLVYDEPREPCMHCRVLVQRTPADPDATGPPLPHPLPFLMAPVRAARSEAERLLAAQVLERAGVPRLVTATASVDAGPSIAASSLSSLREVPSVMSAPSLPALVPPHSPSQSAVDPIITRSRPLGRAGQQLLTVAVPSTLGTSREHPSTSVRHAEPSRVGRGAGLIEHHGRVSVASETPHPPDPTPLAVGGLMTGVSAPLSDWRYLADAFFPTESGEGREPFAILQCKEPPGTRIVPDRTPQSRGTVAWRRTGTVFGWRLLRVWVLVQDHYRSLFAHVLQDGSVDKSKSGSLRGQAPPTTTATDTGVTATGAAAAAASASMSGAGAESKGAQQPAGAGDDAKRRFPMRGLTLGDGGVSPHIVPRLLSLRRDIPGTVAIDTFAVFADPAPGTTAFDVYWEATQGRDLVDAMHDDDHVTPSAFPRMLITSASAGVDTSRSWLPMFRMHSFTAPLPGTQRVTILRKRPRPESTMTAQEHIDSTECTISRLPLASLWRVVDDLYPLP